MSLTVAKNQTFNEVKRHFLIWIIWQGINSLGLIKDWNEVPKMPLLYNYLSLVVLFYPIYYCAKGYWQEVEYAYAQTLYGLNRFKYFFFRRRVLLILFFIFNYIIGSWFIDRHLFHIMYNNFSLYCNGRWTRASTYVFVAIGYSYIKYIHARYKAKLQVADMSIEAANIKIVILKEFIAKTQVEQHVSLHDLIRRVDEYTASKTG